MDLNRYTDNRDDNLVKNTLIVVGILIALPVVVLIIYKLAGYIIALGAFLLAVALGGFERTPNNGNVYYDNREDVDKNEIKHNKWTLSYKVKGYFSSTKYIYARDYMEALCICKSDPSVEVIYNLSRVY